MRKPFIFIFLLISITLLGAFNNETVNKLIELTKKENNLKTELKKVEIDKKVFLKNFNKEFKTILNSILNSDISKEEKISKLKQLHSIGDKKHKKTLSKEIVNLTLKDIRAAKKEAIKVMKDKKTSNFDKMVSWQKFTNISKGTKYEKSGLLLVKKFANKAYKDLAKQFSIAEKNRDNEKMKQILKKIYILPVKPKLISIFKIKQKKFGIVLTDRVKVVKNKDDKGEKIDHVEKVKNKDDKDNNVAVKVDHIEKKEIKTDKEIKKKSSVITTHPLLKSDIKTFRAPLYNKDVAKINMFDILDYVGDDTRDKKKLVLLTFYANHCKPCKKELPYLNKIYSEYKDKGLLVVAANTDKDSDEIVEVKQFIKDNNLVFPVLKDKYNLIAQRYKIETFPTMFFINSKGKIIYVTVGYDSDEEGLKRKILNHLK